MVKYGLIYIEIKNYIIYIWQIKKNNILFLIKKIWIYNLMVPGLLI